MPTSASPTKIIRHCFFFSLAFVIVIPITCVLLGVSLHPEEFEYSAEDPTPDSSTRKVSFSSSRVTVRLSERSPYVLI